MEKKIFYCHAEKNKISKKFGQKVTSENSAKSQKAVPSKKLIVIPSILVIVTILSN